MPADAAYRAKKRFGQHFLRDRRVLERIADALDPVTGARVLEIGPGLGALTTVLLSRGAHVAAVEVDRELAERLRVRCPSDRLTIVEGDVLSLPFADITRRAGWPADEPIAVVGNLPYNISKPVAMRLVERRADVSRAVLMFQREVAERLTAAPGSRAYGPLSVLVGLAFEVRIAFDVRPAAFRPPPAVLSTVTVWAPRSAGPLEDEVVSALRACLRACFAHRRRTVLNNLRVALPGGEPDARARLERAGIDPGLRAERLAPEQFLRLCRHWPAEAPR